MANWVAASFGVLVVWNVLLDGQHTSSSADPLSAQNHANLLQNFVKSVLRAEPALQWIRQQSELIESARFKRQLDNIDEEDKDKDKDIGMSPRRWSEWDDDVVAADEHEFADKVKAGEEAWYNSFRENECDGNPGEFCERFHGKEQQDLSGFGTPQLAEKEVDWFETYKNYGNNFKLEDVKLDNMDLKKISEDSAKIDAPPIPPIELLNINNGNSDTFKNNDFDTSHNFETTNRDYRQVDDQAIVAKSDLPAEQHLDEQAEAAKGDLANAQLHSELQSHEFRHLEDQTDTTKNDLSHEAKYKLSKGEQDRAGTNKPGRRRKRSTKQQQHQPAESLKHDSKAVKTTNNMNDLSAGEDIDANYDDDDETEESDSPEMAALNEDNNHINMRKLRNEENVGLIVKPLPNNTDNHCQQSTTAGSTTTTASPANSIGITVDVKINNVTRQHMKTTEAIRRRKKEANMRPRRAKHDENDSIDDLISGKLPGEIVNAVFQMVRSSGDMSKHLRPYMNLNEKVQVFNPATQKYQTKLKANGLLQQVITSMNNIIHDQVNEQTCVQLRPDLQHYVDDIRDFYAQDRLAQGRNEDSYDDGEETQRPKRRPATKYKRSARHALHPSKRSCNRNTIHEKYTIIIGLIEQFDLLDPVDRVQVHAQKRYLDDHLHLLDELKAFVKHNHVPDHSEDGKSATDSESSIIKRTDPSPKSRETAASSGQFRKLVRTVDLMRQNLMLDDAERETNGFDQEYDAFDGGAESDL